MSSSQQTILENMTPYPPNKYDMLFSPELRAICDHFGLESRGKRIEVTEIIRKFEADNHLYDDWYLDALPFLDELEQQRKKMAADLLRHSDEELQRTEHQLSPETLPSPLQPSQSEPSLNEDDSPRIVHQPRPQRMVFIPNFEDSMYKLHQFHNLPRLWHHLWGFLVL
jgi:hypothetical protein